MRERFKRLAVLLVPTVSSLAGAVIGVSRLGWPSTDYWIGKQSWVIGCIAVVAVAPILQILMSELGERRRRETLEREERIKAVLVPSLIVAVRECGAPWEQTGVQVFKVKSFFRWRKRHVRVAKLRLSPIPSSGILWGEGKGVIGLCWETRTAQWKYLDGSFTELGTVSEGRWGQLSKKQTYGLGYGDYKILGRKYGTVAAVPMIGKNDKYLGCVTLDTPAGVRLENPKAGLESLAATADIVRHQVEG